MSACLGVERIELRMQPVKRLDPVDHSTEVVHLLYAEWLTESSPHIAIPKPLLEHRVAAALIGPDAHRHILEVDVLVDVEIAGLLVDRSPSPGGSAVMGDRDQIIFTPYSAVVDATKYAEPARIVAEQFPQHVAWIGERALQGCNLVVSLGASIRVRLTSGDRGREIDVRILRYFCGQY